VANISALGTAAGNFSMISLNSSLFPGYDEYLGRLLGDRTSIPPYSPNLSQNSELPATLLQVLVNLPQAIIRLISSKYRVRDLAFLP